MSMSWFGTPWNARVCIDCPQTETPVGTQCQYCEEPIQMGERGVVYANGPVNHIECFMRSLFGSVAHQNKTCACFIPGSTEADPPGLSLREAAREALRAAGQEYLLG